MLDNAFLIVWNDVSPQAEAEFQTFHRVEHMPERLAIPGFTLGRRYVDPGSMRYRYLTLYEVTAPSVFESETYRERLASPTPWTQRMSANMCDFVRRVCRTAASDGVAIGAAAATLWLRVGDGQSGGAFASALVARVMELESVAAAHVGLVDAEATGARRDEMQNRAAQTTEDFNGVLIVECDNRAALAGMMTTIEQAVADTMGAPAVATQIYDLALIYHPTWQGAPGVTRSGGIVTLIREPPDME